MGYCQGLNFLAGSFLLVMSDDMVFWHIYSLLVIISNILFICILDQILIH